MAGQYAANSSVSPERSRNEIEKLLSRYGASEFGYATRAEAAAIQFTAHNRSVRMTIVMPDKDSRAITRTPTGQLRSQAQVNAAYDQAVRQRWRALVLVLKAKLEAVAAGITTFEREFAGDTVLPGGKTVWETVSPLIETAYITGEVAPLLQIGASHE